MLLQASFSCTVIVEVVTPSATIEAGAAEISDVVPAAGPGVSETASVSVIPAAFTVPVTVAVPGVVTEVRIAV